MDVKQFRIRIGAVLAVLLAILVAFGGVLADLQIANASYYREKSSRGITTSKTVQAARGEILDRYGRVLVSNRTSYQVTLDTQLMGNTANRNRILTELLDVCRDQGVVWTDTLPVTAAAPYAYAPTDASGKPYLTTLRNADGTEAGTKPSSLARLLDLLKLVKGLPSDPAAAGYDKALLSALDGWDAAKLVRELRDYFEVDPALSEDEGRALVGVLCEVTMRSRDVLRTSYVFAEDVQIGFTTAVKERGLAGVSVDPVSVRAYDTTVAAQLLGQVGSITSDNWDSYKDKGYSMTDTVGIDGTEAAFETYLQGKSGTKDLVLSKEDSKVVNESWRVDAQGNTQEPEPGNNVMLTLDEQLQAKVEELLAKYTIGMTADSRHSAAVVMDMTGGVLASASYPTYDPSTYYQNYNALAADPDRPLFNRALQGLYAPGSIFKMAVAIGALETGAITPTEKILDTGIYKHYKRAQDQPKCWYYRQYGKTHGLENVSEAIRDSCNVFFYETGVRMGIETLDDYAAQFGLGEATGLELFEYTGAVAGPAYSAAGGSTWYEGNVMSAAIGQGDTTATPIQLANYTATLVNGGKHYPTHLLKAVKSSDFSELVEEYRPEVKNTVEMAPENLAAVKYGMYMVANEGTVAKYFKDLGVTVGAKTGSVQVKGNENANATFVAFAPYDNPEIALALVVEKGGSGSELGAVAAEIFQYYFSAKSAAETTPAENTLLQ